MNGHIAVFGMLSGAAGLAALVGDRIYPDVMPDSPTYPSVTYQKMPSGPGARGAVSNPSLAHAEFQVSSWAKSRLAASQIAAQVRAAMDRVRKTTVADVAVDDCFCEGDIDLYDSETRTYFNHMTFTIHYRP